MNELTKLKPSEFIEKYMNIKLLDYQKTFVDNYNSKCKYYSHPRSNAKKIRTFIQGMRYAFDMSDNDMVTIIKPDKNIRLNREEFIEWLSEELKK